MRADKKPKLTQRHIEILEYLAKGLTNTEIGRMLNLSGNTVKVHVARIYLLLEVTNRTEAAMYYKQLQKEMMPDIDSVILVDAFECRTDTWQKASRVCESVTQDLQSGIIAGLSRRKLFNVVKGNSSYHGAKSYRLTGEIKEDANGFEIRVHLETSPDGTHVWNNTFREVNTDYSECLGWCTNKIVASIINHLISHEANIFGNIPMPDRSIVQNIIVGLHKLEIRSKELLSDTKKIFDYVLGIEPQNIIGLYGRGASAYLSILNHFSCNILEDCKMVRQCSVSAMNCSQSSVETWILQGMNHLLNSDISGAIVSFKNVLRIDPSYQSGYFILGQMLSISGKYQSGHDLIDRGISLCPEYRYSGNNLVAMGIVYFGLSQYGKAIQTLQESSYLQSDSLIGRLLYISSLYHNGEVPKACSEADKFKSDLDLFDKATIAQTIRLADHDMLSRLSESLEAVGLELLKPQETINNKFVFRPIVTPIRTHYE